MDSTGNVYTDSRMFSCNSTSSGSLVEWGHNNSDCSGNHDKITMITLNGSCTTMECLGFNEMEYDTSGCTGQATQNYTDEYVYWLPDQCMYNITQTCVSGQPQSSFYNNTQCTGTPQFVVIAGKCLPHGHQRSAYYVATDNPCSTN